MAITKVTTPDLINLPYNNTDGIILPKGPTAATFSCDYLVLAGGGGGGNFGGGGAGGLLTTYATSPVTASGSETKLDLSVSVAYTVTVGTGGAGNTSYGSIASSGNNSVFHNITATGGGAGNKSSSNTTDINGGSGGGSGWNFSSAPAGSATPAGQGFDGGTGANNDPSPSNFLVGGGGGGASATPATPSVGTSPGAGGEGVDVTITGATVDYAGGGGGVGYYTSNGSGAAPSKGGGGAGTNWGGSTSTLSPVYAGTNGKGGGGGAGGNGGSGVVVIRVPTGITATFSGGVTANGSTGGTIAPDTSTGDNIWIVTATTNSSQTITFSGTLSSGRPASAVDGEFRYNTTDKKVEYYDGSNWYQLSSSPAVPQAGTTTTCNYPTTATALYQFEGNANDTCGVYNATSVTDVTYSSTAPAKFGQYALAGSSPEIVTGITQDSNAAFTWSFWFYATANSGIDPIIAAISTTNIFDSINVGLEFNTIFLFTAGSNRGSGSSISLNTWTHYAVTFDGSNGFVTYLNGSVAENITQTPPSFTGGNVKLMLNIFGSWGYYEGRLDQLRIYPTVLTATQVNALYTETAP